jgi:hypothetical protein
MHFHPHDEQGNPTGAFVTLENVAFAPLPYEQLAAAKLGDRITVKLQWRDARVTESTVEGIDIGLIAAGNATLDSHFSSRTIGLVPGGWIPPGLALQSDMIVLPDRCTISEIRGRFRDGVKKGTTEPDFLDLFAGRRVRINPMLFALEGNQRRDPTPREVAQQLEEAVTHLQLALPLAEVIGAGGVSLNGLLGLLEETAVGTEAKREFLMRLAPRIHAPVRAERRGALWDEILRTAIECKVEPKSLVVIAALSSIAAPMTANPAKLVLKLKQRYTIHDAYNALADLRALELLMTLFGRFPSQAAMLCTGDKNLALFWAGVGASNFAWEGGHASFTLSPVDSFFAGIDEARQGQYFDLATALRADDE